jgi:hypothetical protein
VSEGPNAGIGKWRPDAGVSVSLVLEERRRLGFRWRLTNASVGNARFGSVTPAHPFR